MLTNLQKGQAVVAAMEENQPQLLAHLAQTNKLAETLDSRVKAYNQEYVKRMKGADPREEGEIVESLMPMLTEFPHSQNPKPLSSQQQTLAYRQLQEWADKLPPMILPPTPK